MLYTDKQRRWWFVNHPDDSGRFRHSKQRGPGARTGREGIESPSESEDVFKDMFKPGRYLDHHLVDADDEPQIAESRSESPDVFKDMFGPRRYLDPRLVDSDGEPQIAESRSQRRNRNDPNNRVKWAWDQYEYHKDDWKHDSLFDKRRYGGPGEYHCNEFVADAHQFGDPDARNYPTVNRGGYTTPTAADLADPNFAKGRLLNVAVGRAKPGDIFVWYGGPKEVHHVGLYMGKDEDGKDIVMYQQPVDGLRIKTISDLTKQFKVQPIVRRYKY